MTDEPGYETSTSQLSLDQAEKSVELSEYRVLRLSVLARDHYRCQWPGCGRHRKLTVHHIIFKSYGGKDEADNLITLCQRCHQGLHRTVDQVRQSR